MIFLRRFFLLWVTLSVVLIFRNAPVFFGPPVHEVADEASDAVQVLHAKQFREIHGNYSRWGFHHPGPAPLYVYAAGEALFFDLLKMVKSPFAGHCLMANIVMACFFSIAFLFFSKYLRDPRAFSIGLLLAAIHFSLIPKYFVTAEIPNDFFARHWPPAALFAPFLCLVSSVLLLWEGERAALFTALFSGFFMLHGHLAAPLFVAPLWVSGGLGYFLAIRKGKAPQIDAKTIFLFLLLSLPFLSVWAMDLFHGEDSNLRRIWGHLKTHQGASQPLGLVIMYLGSFWTYMADDPFPVFGVGFRRPIQALLPKIPLILFGLFSLGSVVRVLYQKKEKVLLGNLILLFGIFFVWSIKQDGTLFIYNALLFYGVIFLIYWIWLCNFSFKVRPWFVVVAVGIFVSPVIWRKYPAETYGREVLAATEKAVAQNPQNILLLPTQANWATTASVSLALERMKIPYQVAGMKFMFGLKTAVGSDLEEKLLSDRYQIWNPNVKNKTNCRWEISASMCLNTDAASLPLDGTSFSINLSELDYYPFLPPSRELGKDFLRWGPWQTGLVIALPIRSSRVTSDIQLRVDQTDGERYQSIRWDGRYVALSDKRELLIPKSEWNSRSLHLFLIELPPYKDIGPNPFHPKLTVSFRETTPLKTNLVP